MAQTSPDDWYVLPPVRSLRWTKRRKAAVVLAVTSGRLAISDACSRYRISADEFAQWQRQVEEHQAVRSFSATRAMNESRCASAASPHCHELRLIPVQFVKQVALPK